MTHPETKPPPITAATKFLRSDLTDGAALTWIPPTIDFALDVLRAALAAAGLHGAEVRITATIEWER